jgi:hypothetical protein
MKAALELIETEGGDVWITRDGDNVELEALQVESALRGCVCLTLTPGQAVKLSRALVAAAAEALRVEV